MLGQLGFSAMNAAYRAKFDSQLGWRRANHSTSLRAATSSMVCFTIVASPILDFRTSSIACLMPASSGGSEMAGGVVAGALTTNSGLDRAASAECLLFLCAEWRL